VEEIKGSILVVDDDPSLVEVVTNCLKDEGYFAIGATDGEEAINILHMASFDLILLDIQMARVSGDQVVQVLKKQSIATPVVIMTGRSRAREYAERLAVAGYLEKPFGLDELFAAVEAHL
jgi:DNA-binding response OmpR family regulator